MLLEDCSHLTYGSNKKVSVKCDLSISDKCWGKYTIRYSSYFQRNKNGKIACSPCAIKKGVASGIDIGKYNYDRSFFKNIDSPEKAWLLGWIGSDGSITKHDFRIRIHTKDANTLKMLKNIINPDANLFLDGVCIGFKISSREIVSDLVRLFKLNSPGKKSHTVQFPDCIKNSELGWYFLQGYFEGDGYINTPKKEKRPRCSIKSSSSQILNDIKNFCKIQCSISGTEMYWSGRFCMQLLNKIYGNIDNGLFLERKLERYLLWRGWIPYNPKTRKKNKPINTETDRRLKKNRG